MAAPLCEGDSLLEGAPIGVSSARGELILLRLQSGVIAYDNRCPHRGTTLDWAKDRFLSADGEYLQCATHGALFRKDDGVCVHGPCLGEGLVRVAIDEREGALFLGDRG